LLLLIMVGWIRRFYVGSRERFDKVMAVSAKAGHVFDFSLHVRTISILEVSTHSCLFH